jgi:hypothetical protein
MTAPFSGGCACGSIRYICSRAPVATLNCHCLDCQRSSGAPFASGFIVRVSDITITGTPKSYSVRAGSGRLATRSFCSDCGSPLCKNRVQFGQRRGLRHRSVKRPAAIPKGVKITRL